MIDLTIGGLVSGGGIESTSHKYGLFQYICKSFEMVLADASVVTCSKDERPDLFMAIPFSYGTLGFLTSIEMDIIPYKPYVKLTYVPTYSLDETVHELTRIIHDPAVDSVEGIMYSLNRGVIMSGKYTDTFEKGKLNRINRWYKPWFYKHAQRFLDSPPSVTGTEEEYIPTTEFNERHMKGIFWCMEHICPFGNNVFFRYLLGWMLPPKQSLLKWMRTNLVPADNNENFSYTVQDYGYPLEILKPCLEFVDEQTKIYPLWLCPAGVRAPPELEHLSPLKNGSIYIDVGIYG